ncbi:MAG: CcmE/CycJ protein [Proteobacteria bacterium]|nr:CcmE/CycJ protein [Pseudomonadota bacterium]
MKTRHKRIALIVGGLVILGVVVALVLNAFQSNLVFFFSPTQVAAGEAPRGKSFRVGGLVKAGSIVRESDGVTLRFVMTDMEKEMTVAYKGILPDLFREGKGAVAQGKLADDGIFVASEVLAKHDENYMPPEAAKALGDASDRAAATQAAEQAAAKTLKP